MGNYLNPYIQGGYVEDDISPVKGTLEWALLASNLVGPIAINNTKLNVDDLRKSLAFDLEGAQLDNDTLEKQFQEATANVSTNNPKVGLFNNLFLTIGNGFSTFGKTLGKGINKGFNTLANNQGLQNAAFGLANSFIQPVNSSSGENTFFTVGDAFADKLKGGAGLATKTAMTALKVLNSAGGKHTLDFSVNQNAISPIMGSYNDSSALFTNAASKAGLKYSVLNDKKRREVDAMIREARRQQNAITNLALEAEDLLSMVDDMDYLDYQNEMNGGFDQRFLRAAKQGMKFKTLNRIRNLNFNSKKLKEGGFIEYKEWTPVIITDTVNYYQQGGTLNEKKSTRTIEELIAYAKEQNPRFIQRMSEPLRYVKVNYKDKEGKDMWGHSTHLMTNRGNKVFPLVLEDPKGQLFIIDDEDKALNWATLNNNVLTFDTEEEALNFQNNYKQGWPDFFNASPLDTNPEAEYEEYEPHKYKLLNLYSSVRELFKEGGKLKEETTEEVSSQKNLIPEGALHKNKHHMEYADDLTKKGIPVIDNDGDLQAEIECDELILNLDNTKFIEERYNKFYSDELTLKEKDQLAIEVGELLVKEILYNTDDRTDLINKVE